MTDRPGITECFGARTRPQPIRPASQLLGLYDLDVRHRPAPKFEETTTDGIERPVRSRAGPPMGS